jgi:hypothetical protein
MAEIAVGSICRLDKHPEFVWRVTQLLPDNVAECEWIPNPKIISRYSTYRLRPQ